MKNVFRFRSVILLAGIIILLTAGCKKDTSEEPSSGIIIPSTTKVITSADWKSGLVSIDSISHTYVFNSSVLSTYNLKTGDVMVSDVGNGCLRKISGITSSGGLVTVTTTQASLSDAIEDAESSFNLQMTPDKIKSIRLLDRNCRIRPVMKKSGNNACFSYELTTYLDDAQKVMISATLSIDPSVHCSYKIKRFSVKYLNIEFQVAEQIDITSTIELLNIEWEKEKKLLEVEFTPITVMIGPVPVVITPSIEISAGINLNVHSDVTTGITQNLTYTVGITYNSANSGNKWSSYTEIDKGFGFTPPTLNLSAEAKAYLKPQFNLEIYEVLSPYLFAELYGKIAVDISATPWWVISAGAGIGAGVKVEIWGYNLIDYETDPPPILYEVVIAQAPGSKNSPPDEPKDPIPADNANDVGTGSSLSWTCTDPDSDPLKYDIYFGTSNPPPLVQSDATQPSYQPASMGYSTVYYWRVEAKDDHDHTRVSPLWTFSTESQGGGTGTPCPGTASVIYEGKVYHTALIGSQCWLQENLSVGTMILSSATPSNNSIIEKFCYQNIPANCGVYGGLYTWDELMAYASAAGAQGICPQGWHLPTDEEWKSLEIALGMSASEADLTGWRGTDQGTQLKTGGSSGFEALMAGILNLGFFSDLSVNTYFATSSSPSAANIWARQLNETDPKISRYQTLKQNAISVRCLKN
jgi:uncharacterized protein (TIGR02145 family)